MRIISGTSSQSNFQSAKAGRKSSRLPLRFQSRYFEQVDCVTASSAACVDATPAAMAMWGAAAAVSAFIATAFTGYAVLRFWRGLARGGA